MSQVSEHERIFVCATCGRTFSPTYKLSRHRTLSACSKSCAGKLKGGEFHRKSDLVNKAVETIKKAGRYMPHDEMVFALGVSSKTLVAYGVSTLMCNKQAGFKKPSRVFESKVYEALCTRFNHVATEATFPECKSPKGYPLRFDFYVESESLLIEADGSQHKAGHPWHREYHLQCDGIKDAFAADNGMRLVRVPYSKRVTPEYVFRFLETSAATT
jgi:hypothetical protein